VREEVARVDKRDVRRRLMHALRAGIEAAGGIWLRLAPWPFPYRSAFNFRFDHDEYHPQDFETVLSAIAGHEAATSHYVCAATHAGSPDALARLRGLDVGSHGYRHHTYQDPEENLHNLRRGIEALQQAGLKPSGFVAPHGRFNRGLLWAMEQLGIGHSSEFGFAYDDWPQFPADSRGIFLEAWTHGRGVRPDAQLPVATATDYLQQLAKTNYQAGEPVFLYGHPDSRVGRYPELLRGVLETVSRFASIWKTDRTTMATWWRARDQVRVRVFRDEDSFVVVTDALPRQFPLAAEYWRGEHVATMPLARKAVRFSPSAVAYEARRHYPIARAVRLDRSEGLRGSVRRYLDWERVTPLAEIGTRTWRGWVKKTLRRIRQ
jgi:peptidoglycan/xylan/chitin deacetylase (PgdA/CDA1 family)